MPKDEKIVTPGEQEPGNDNARRGRRGGPGGGRGPNKGAASSDDANKRMESEWEEKIIQVRRVTKVVKGGKKLSFRAVVAIGNGKGSSWYRCW